MCQLVSVFSSYFKDYFISLPIIVLPFIFCFSAESNCSRWTAMERHLPLFVGALNFPLCLIFY